MPADQSNKPPPDQLADLEELARRYVDLWQDQMTSLASDPEFAESLQKVMATMGVAAGGLPALWAAWPAAMGTVMAAARTGQESGREIHGEPAGGKRDNGGSGAAAAGPAAAAAAPDGGGADLGVLQERLAALEQRVASLEGGLGRARRKPAKGSAAKPKRE
ncbi:MAG: hypothetical protein Kow00114_09470 [Kiloniellaceae bacterium]